MKRAAALALAWALVQPQAARAGAQIYEPIAESVRNQLRVAVSHRAPPVLNFGNAQDAHRWSSEMSKRLRARIPDRRERDEFLKTVHYYALRAGLDPQLVLGLIHVESRYKRYAVSSAGAMGLMQVMPFWVKVIGQPGDNLFDMKTNIVYGCAILRHYLDRENGDYFRALGRYNGSLGRPEYPNAVHASWKGQWGYDGATS
jgi:soluble lytic murein transglycosylase-like protein